ncbi:MAG: hypothetical protein U0228_38870 [Myxococcaceae bacterium]
MVRSSRFLLLAGLAACGDATMHVDDQASLQSGPSVTVIRDAGTNPHSNGGGSGEFIEVTGSDAGLPVVDAGEPVVVDAGLPVVDAGRPPDCEGSETRSCTTSCQSTGVQQCAGGEWGTCQRPSEQCSNGQDDDCDGRVDSDDSDCPAVIVRCETTEGNGCNGDLGYGDHCAPSDNTGGCSAERFSHWCNRRNPATPDQWDAYIENWVDSRCDGTVTTENGGATFTCLDSSNRRFQCTTPLVLVFEGDTALPLAGERRFAFVPGRPMRAAWPRAQTPWLVRDVNGNGRIDDGSELFGSSTRLGEGRTAKDGFEALAALDENHDGVVDRRDPAFAQLRLWTGDGALVKLSARGVTSLDVKPAKHVACDGRGNCERGRSRFGSASGGGVVVDLWLRTVSLSPRGGEGRGEGKP